MTSGFWVGDELGKGKAKRSKPKARRASGAGRSQRAERWLEENMEALESSNRWVEEHGLPFAEFRLF